MLHMLFSVYLKMLVLYSPFFVLSCFISLTRGYSNKERRRLAWKVALATLISSVLLYLFGRTIFSVFGITVDAFRIGAGSVDGDLRAGVLEVFEQRQQLARLRAVVD